MEFGTNALAEALLVLVAIDVLVATATWFVARDRTTAPGLVAGCNLALGLFPPFNLLALTLLAILPARPGP
jgi:hypothetical protein